MKGGDAGKVVEDRQAGFKQGSQPSAGRAEHFEGKQTNQTQFCSRDQMVVQLCGVPRLGGSSQKPGEA